MLYNRCTGIYKFGNNTYPRRIRRRSNLGHIFREKIASYGPGNTVFAAFDSKLVSKLILNLTIFYKLYVACIKQSELWELIKLNV
jgi:hypothetical protein